MKTEPLIVRTASWSATHPVRAIVIWAVFIVACVAAGAITGSNQIQGKDGWVGDQGRAAAIVDGAGLNPPPVEKILITSTAGTLDLDKAATTVADLKRRMHRLPIVAGVGKPIRSADGTALMVAVTLKGTGKAASKHLPSLRTQVAAAQAAHPGLRLAQTGTVSTGNAPGQQLAKDLARAELITLPVTLVILLLVFGSILAAGVPLVLALSSVFAAMGLYAVASYVFPDAGGAVANIILMMGMAVGVDYSLFYVKRVREEHERSGGKIDNATAVRLAAATSGRAVAVSGLAIVVALIGLYFAGDAIYTSVATGTIIVVLISVISSLTVLPALLAKLGGRITRSRFRHRSSGRLWPTLLRPALRHPAATLALATAGMLALALPLTAVKIGQTGADTYPKSIPAIATYHQLTKLFPAEGYFHLVVARGPAASSDRVTAALTDVYQQANRNPLFVRTAGAKIRTSADRTVSTLELPVPYGLNAPQAAESLRLLRNDLLPGALRGITGADHGVSGEIARATDYVDHQNQQMPWVLGFALLATFLMMIAAFRSVVIALAGIVLNVLSYAAAFGAVVAVFQYSWAERLLGFESVGFISDRVPLILFVILFGLSMDYQVFVVSRIREAAQRGVTTRQAVAEGIVSSAGVVTIAAVIMVSVFGSFLFVGLTEMKEIAFGLALAVLLDAIVVRALILPALLTLLGKASWWPSRPHRAAASVIPAQPGSVTAKR